MGKEKQTSYYKETIPDVIEKLQEMVENNLEIVGKNISILLSDNKKKSALESRRLACEDVIWAAKEIDRMELELSEIEEEDKEEFLEKSYFRRIIPRLIKELKGMVENNLKVVGKEITALTDDKLKQALSSRRIGAEDAVWASKQVDELERILTGKSEEEEDNTPVNNWTKRKASN